jgi:type V secretory pathway adhesin AidA
MRRGVLALGLFAVLGCYPQGGGVLDQVILPEQRTIEYVDPAQLPAAKIPPIEPPRTVSNPRPLTPKWELSLDEAIRIGLENAEVVRVLAGVAATSSGSTIYDTAITNTTIDQEQGRFDPAVTQDSTWTRTENSSTIFDPQARKGVRIFGNAVDAYRSQVGLDKVNVLGGEWTLNWIENPTRFGGDGFFPRPPS